MTEPLLILNERDAKTAKTAIQEIDGALSSEMHFNSIIEGLPLELVNGYRRTLTTQKAELLSGISFYEKAKAGDVDELIKSAGSDIGVFLIVARIIKRLSQKDLARRVGLKEQQIQRYEADRYRSISLSNFKRMAHALGVNLRASIPEGKDGWVTGADTLTNEYSPDEIKKVLKHGRENGWFEADVEDEDAEGYLQRYVTEHLLKYGSPTLLRTGLNVHQLSEELGLIAWKARVTKIAETIIEENKLAYNWMDISWLKELVHLSRCEDGPAKAKDLLLQHGIVLVAEPQIPGLTLDGAAFLVDRTPVIALTLRRDTIDNFWFTLLHETGHIVLHYRMGLGTGFFDDTEQQGIDEIEKEANEFASNMLIPSDKWKRSPARISKSPEAIERFAEELGIHPAIVFGRIQKERNDWKIFSNKTGRGEVKKWLIKS